MAIHGPSSRSIRPFLVHLHYQVVGLFELHTPFDAKFTSTRVQIGKLWPKQVMLLLHNCGVPFLSSPREYLAKSSSGSALNDLCTKLKEHYSWTSVPPPPEVELKVVVVVTTWASSGGPWGIAEFEGRSQMGMMGIGEVWDLLLMMC